MKDTSFVSSMGAKGVGIVAEAEGYLVATKPGNMLIHPTRPGQTGTFWHHLRELLAYEIANGGGVSIINRLDRETSGLVLVAKTSATARDLCGLMQRGAIKKHYLTIAKGWPKELQFSVNAPILRRGLVEPSAIWLKQMVHTAGSAALTHFRLLDRLTDGQGERFSLIEAEPVTGRMHQIRVHLAHAGHSVVGDKLYGPDERCYLEFIETGWTATLAARLSMPRQALHSARLEIREHPFAAVWEAPVPEDMRQFLAGLNKADMELSA